MQHLDMMLVLQLIAAARLICHVFTGYGGERYDTV